MILTVTPNPSVDYLFEAETLCWDDANRVEMPRRRAGGQGINLTRAARVLGGRSTAIALFGGPAGAELKTMLMAESTPFIDVPIDADSRVFFGVRETGSGRSMLVNPRGPILSETDAARLLGVVEKSCVQLQPRWLVCSGSIPRGLGNDLYARIGAIAHQHNINFVADCDGQALTLAVRSGCDVITPNKHEAERLTSASICSFTDALRAVEKLQAIAPCVLLKLGAEGAIAADRSGIWSARGPVMQSGSAVGAGDTFLAAFLVAKENGALLGEALRSAVAAGTAVLQSRGTDLLTGNDYEAMLHSVTVTPVSGV